MQNDYQFEPVHIDWSGLRTQMIIGLLAIFCLCLVNFISFRQLKNFDLVDLFSDFTLYFASCSLVALITLAIGRSAGNRNGAACAIWAALIFASHYHFCFGGGVKLIPYAQQLIWISGIIISTILCWRLIARAISWITAGKLVFCLWAGYTFAQAAYPGSIILGSATLAIVITLACLPTLGAASARVNVIYGSLGLIALSLLAIAYEY